MSSYLVEKNGEHLAVVSRKSGQLIGRFPAFLSVAGYREFHYFAHGNHNLAYLSVDRKWVLRMPILSDESSIDYPARLCRLWNLINPEYPAVVCDDVWISPFVESAKSKVGTTVVPTSVEISKKILQIYQATGRVLLDAFVKNNFVKAVNGDVVCIDVGAAFLFEERGDLPGLTRVKSNDSLDAWYGRKSERSSNLSLKYRLAFERDQNDSRYALIISTIRALLYMQKHAPDFRATADLLPELLSNIAFAYKDNPDYCIENFDQLLLSIAASSSAQRLQQSVNTVNAGVNRLQAIRDMLFFSPSNSKARSNASVVQNTAAVSAGDGFLVSSGEGSDSGCGALADSQKVPLTAGDHLSHFDAGVFK